MEWNHLIRVYSDRRFNTKRSELDIWAQSADKGNSKRMNRKHLLKNKTADRAAELTELRKEHERAGTQDGNQTVTC